jgi:hypothetical protein
MPRPSVTPCPWGWTAYAACVWGIAYAVFVRFYQAAGGTIGLAGRFEDADGFRRASLFAGLLILVAGLGALALVRPWGLRIPRWLLLAPALAGSVYAMAHALVAYVSKTLPFYELWFLGLWMLVTLAALHHYCRTGGFRRGPEAPGARDRYRNARSDGVRVHRHRGLMSLGLEEAIGGSSPPGLCTSARGVHPVPGRRQGPIRIHPRGTSSEVRGCPLSRCTFVVETRNPLQRGGRHEVLTPDLPGRRRARGAV